MRESKSTQCNLGLRIVIKMKEKASQTNKVSTGTLFSDYEVEQRLKISPPPERIEDRVKEFKDSECQTDGNYFSQPKCGDGPDSVKKQFNSIVSTFKRLISFEMESSNSQVYIKVTRKGMFDIELGDPCWYILSPEGKLSFHVTYKGLVREWDVVKEGKIITELVEDLFADFSSKENVFCTGLDGESVDIIPKLAKPPKKLVRHSLPKEHCMSTDCPAWFKKPVNSHGPLENVCTACKNLRRYLRLSLKRRVVGLNPVCRKRKIDPSSTCPVTFLSPSSANLKKRRQHYRFQYMKIKNAKLKEKVKDLTITLKDSQHKEMKSIVSIIEESFPEDLDKVLKGKDPSTNIEERKRLRQIWDNDCRMYLQREKDDLEKDQKRNAPGHTGNRWTVLSYRIALAVGCRSKAAYEALKSFKILNLPSWRSIQRKTTKNIDDPGINMEYLKEQKRIYNTFASEEESLGFLKPRGDGILIFDEVRVAGKVCWNSKNHKLMGVAMPIHEYAYLDDLYKEVSDEKKVSKANYMLQFLWRDLTSNYDVIGPYFSLANTADTQITFNCLFEVIKAFQFAGFNISGLVCDGASANLALIKLTVGLEGQFSYSETENCEEIDIKFNPCFPNPHRLGRNIYWIICPSHQMKSMINALYSSHDERAKKFQNLGIEFGWSQIVELKQRDDHRRKLEVPRLVPKLLQSYVDRDPWTKLNVKPAKILQQMDVLSALHEYANPVETSPPKDHYEVKATLEYLKACNKLFETGTLSSDKITSLGSDVMVNLRCGLNYFEDWLKYLIVEDTDFKPWSIKQKKFISWQTWALLRIMVFGMEGLVKEYFETHPMGYYICPVRINGSGVETLFSQFKQNSGGKLSSVNYCTSRKNYLTKVDTRGHHSGRGYRDVPLYVKDSFAEKYKSETAKSSTTIGSSAFLKVDKCPRTPNKRVTSPHQKTTHDLNEQNIVWEAGPTTPKRYSKTTKIVKLNF